MTTATRSLPALPQGHVAVITAIHADEALHQRLRALGFRIGQTLQLVRRAAFQGPLQVRIGATDVIIRRRDAGGIQVRLP
jgi:ferrous iron transport protein A